MKKRTNRFLLLGINLGNLLDSNPTSTSMEGATEFCKTILNLIGELDLYMETGETPSNNGRKSNGTTSTIGKNFNFFGSVKGGSKAGKKGMGLGLGLGGSGFVGTGGVGEFGGTGTGGAESIERDSLNYSSGTSSQGVGMTNPGMGNFGGKDEGHLLIVNVVSNRCDTSLLPQPVRFHRVDFSLFYPLHLSLSLFCSGLISKALPPRLLPNLLHSL